MVATKNQILVSALLTSNAERWPRAQITRSGFSAVATRLVAAKARYKAVETKTGVPWPVIAVIHERESTQNWAKSLAQGDRWDHESTHVPAGRGPFASWEEAAIDALVNCGPYAARWKDWSIGGILTLLEQYNGLGYARMGKPSPYIWAGTNQYVRGKYVHDGVYDPDEEDKQLGCAGLLMAIAALDPSVSFAAPLPTSPVAPSPVPAKDAVWLQSTLNRLGADPQLTVDGFLGPATRNAVRAFQLAKGLAVDGIAGPQTIDALDKSTTAGLKVETPKVPPDIVLPPPGTKARTDLAPTFWGRVLDLFRGH